MLSSKQFCGVSNGSACNSNSYNLSYVLSAMDLPEEQIKTSIRISWGPGIDKDKVTEEFKELVKVAKGLMM